MATNITSYLTVTEANLNGLILNKNIDTIRVILICGSIIAIIQVYDSVEQAEAVDPVERLERQQYRDYEKNVLWCLSIQPIFERLERQQSHEYD